MITIYNSKVTRRQNYEKFSSTSSTHGHVEYVTHRRACLLFLLGGSSKLVFEVCGCKREYANRAWAQFEQMFYVFTLFRLRAQNALNAVNNIMQPLRPELVQTKRLHITVFIQSFLQYIERIHVSSCSLFMCLRHMWTCLAGMRRVMGIYCLLMFKQCMRALHLHSVRVKNQQTRNTNLCECFVHVELPMWEFIGVEIL